MGPGILISRTDWGALPTGEAVTHFVLAIKGGITVGVSALGATITDMIVPDRAGGVANVVLGFDSLAGYRSRDYLAHYPFFGATIGRFANRIRDARFSIDDVEYHLAANESANLLHGGQQGFDHRVWRERPNLHDNGIALELTSPDGDQGFPGTLETVAHFRLVAPNELSIRYEARCDAPTHVNLTSHNYFNLGGRSRLDISGHRLSIPADSYLPIDGQALPQGTIEPVGNTPFDLRQLHALGGMLAANHEQLKTGDGFNHTFILAERASDLRHAARLEDPVSGRTLDISTTAPGIHVYTGNALQPPVARRRQALALEPQHFANSPNIEAFPSTLLRPGEIYVSETRLRFSAA